MKIPVVCPKCQYSYAIITYEYRSHETCPICGYFADIEQFKPKEEDSGD